MILTLMWCSASSGRQCSAQVVDCCLRHVVWHAALDRQLLVYGTHDDDLAARGLTGLHLGHHLAGSELAGVEDPGLRHIDRSADLLPVEVHNRPAPRVRGIGNDDIDMPEMLDAVSNVASTASRSLTSA